jgi:hypothetical protein
MKLVLDNKNLTDDFFEDTKLLGIMAPSQRLPALLAPE